MKRRTPRKRRRKRKTTRKERTLERKERKFKNAERRRIRNWDRIYKLKPKTFIMMKEERRAKQ